MNFLEFEGKDPEDAIAQAAAHFKVAQEKLEIEIISLGSSGLFGLLGGKKAKIRAAIKGEVREEPEKTEKESAVGEVAEPMEEGEKEVDLVPRAQEILSQLLEKMGETCTISGFQELNQVNLIVEGEDAGLLIGKQGQTLEALQYLVTKILSKSTKRKPRVIIDIESYRERHKQVLVDLAQKYGEKAKRLGKPVTLNPMNAYDRRIIHLTLQSDRDLKTKSRGEGLYKKIIIYPVKKRRNAEVLNEDE
ncbi:RNA-binding cell elongation regulator Jag/EloR [Desulfobacca acetoxidans]|uniref:RNA-binding protein KhpB n=1 Tax=Desulfobacca acetoxidans (strain ATCC 700848 / DSM 11109 / ASRB2) TaxID=880072 RepID=F2NGV6_DESAR|nr:RNA-binding cell elongation regulator Jag/EloR [Desulfobacca acetoxidans]AEB08727.1 single-stranded nucleic acid binding R3H domain-containing protein [Desulfobacca acetoxidans DSM 11109]